MSVEAIIIYWDLTGWLLCGIFSVRIVWKNAGCTKENLAWFDLLWMFLFLMLGAFGLIVILAEILFEKLKIWKKLNSKIFKK